jgi:hypothetical protein
MGCIGSVIGGNGAYILSANLTGLVAIGVDFVAAAVV